MNITIAGAGNIGTQFTVHCAEKGHQVTLFTSVPQIVEKKLCIVDDNGEVIHEGQIHTATNDPEAAFRHADLIIITFPSKLMHYAAEQIYAHTSEQTIIGVVPGNGGSECAFKKCIERGNVFFGIERVPAIARLIEKGKCVRCSGYRDELHVAALPKKHAAKCADIIEKIFDIRCSIVPCFLNLTMTPSNPILHTTRLRSLFGDWKEGVYYKHVPLFYEEWDDDSSSLLLACDAEVQKICRALPEFNLQYVISLREHYESSTAEEMTKKISSISAFKGLKTPVCESEEGLVPDLHSRYFTADFSYGLYIIQQIGCFAGVKMPNIDETIAWYRSIAVEKDHFQYEDYGIFNIESMKQFYLM